MRIIDLEINAIFFKGFYLFKLIPLVVCKHSKLFISLWTFALLIFTCYLILFSSAFHRCTEVEHMFLSQVNSFLSEVPVNLLLVISIEMFVFTSQNIYISWQLDPWFILYVLQIFNSYFRFFTFMKMSWLSKVLILLWLNLLVFFLYGLYFLNSAFYVPGKILLGFLLELINLERIDIFTSLSFPLHEEA